MITSDCVLSGTISVRRTSEGYQKKYPTSKSVGAMQKAEILGTTIRLVDVS